MVPRTEDFVLRRCWSSIPHMRCAALVAISLTASVAAADAPTARLELTGACELGTVSDSANELLGRVAIAPDAQALFRVVTELAGDTVVATLSYVSDAGLAQQPRTIAATNCDELAESLAVVVSLVLRQEALAAPPVVEPVTGAPSEPVREVEPGVQPVAPPRMRSIELAGAAGSAGIGSVIAGVRMQHGRGSVGLELAVELPTETTIGMGTVDVVTTRAGANGCVRLGPVAACGLLIGGVTRGKGEQLFDAHSVIKPIGGIGARLEWRHLVSSRIGTRVFCDFEQLLATTRFLVDDMPVWTTASRQVWLGAGVFLRMP